MKRIETADAPTPAGHYSQAIVHNGVVFVSGQLPLCPSTGSLVGDDIEDQTRKTLANVQAVLESAGSSLEQILKVTVFVSDIGLWGRVNATYADVMGPNRPARAVVPTRDLAKGALIEIECVAATDGAPELAGG